MKQCCKHRSHGLEEIKWTLFSLLLWWYFRAAIKTARQKTQHRLKHFPAVTQKDGHVRHSETEFESRKRRPCGPVIASTEQENQAWCKSRKQTFGFNNERRCVNIKKFNHSYYERNLHCLTEMYRYRYISIL